MVQDYVNRLLGLIERWGWSIGLILIASIFFVMACAAIISSPAALDPTTAPAFHVAGGLLGVVLVVELAGGFALVTGFKRRIGAIALLILLVITTSSRGSGRQLLACQDRLGSPPD